MYTHHSCIEEFYDSLQTVVTRDMRQELAAAPFGLFGIEADEATDTSNESIIIVHVR